MNLYLFDGSNLAFRAHCAFPETLTVGDFPVSAIYGTCRILNTFCKEFQPGKIVMPFDVGKSKYRLALYPQYKASRDEDPKMKALRTSYSLQIKVITELVSKFGITVLAEETEGIEADDVIAYMVHKFHGGAFSNIHRVLVISSDKDLCALVGPQVIWFDPIAHNLITADNFKEQFGIQIEQYADFKALKGDKSDNIPHPRGIGPANAVKLLTEYGSLDQLLAIKHAKIEPYRDIALLAKQLVTLNLHHVQSADPVWSIIDSQVAKLRTLEPDIEETFQALEFASILADWPELKDKWTMFAAANLQK